MNYSRTDLVEIQAVSNQMRNAIYHLARFMKDNSIEHLEIKKRLRRMGVNIAKTFNKYWKPINQVNLDNLKDFITTLYRKVLNSSISIDIEENDHLVKIIDKNCALCKYHYEDLEIAGCEILLGFVSELISQVNINSPQKSSIFLIPIDVIESTSYGNSSCIQLFKYQEGEER